MADFWIELLGEILEPVFSWLTENHRIPKPIRYGIASLPPAALMALFGYMLAKADAVWEMSLWAGFCLVGLILWIFLLRKVYKS